MRQGDKEMYHPLPLVLSPPNTPYFTRQNSTFGWQHWLIQIVQGASQNLSDEQSLFDAKKAPVVLQSTDGGAFYPRAPG